MLREWKFLQRLQKCPRSNLLIMKTVITVDDNGVITFPKGYLDGLGWEEGDLLEWINHEDGTFELRKIDNA